MATETEAAADGEARESRTEFPCSVAQERFWLLDRLDPGNPSYNVAVRWRLEGAVRADLLEQAWLHLIDRHEILRTVFVERDGLPRQRVLPRSQFKLAEIDLGTLPEEARQAEGDRVGAIEARAPFDVATGPLIRATLLRYSPTVAIILVTTHQIVSDGWSIGIMAREMGTIYQALREGRPIPLDDLPLQYADYSEWQLEWLRVRGTEAETAYWSRRLAGVRPFKVLPDHPRPAVPTTNGAIASIVLPRELTDRAQALSADHATTLFSTALSALTATLARYTGETEIVIGTQVSDRDQVELEGMIGQFVNSLILRNDLSGDPRFGELIERSRETISQALEHRHIPIERLLSLVKADRAGTHAALISVNFIFQRTFIQNSDYGDFRLVDLPSLPAGAIYDLNFFMVERPDGWRFSVQYNTDQFEGETAYRLLQYVQAALAGAVDDDRRRVSELPLVSAEERERLLTTLNRSEAAYDAGATLSSLFGEAVARHHDAIALVVGDRQWTYRQLDGKVNRLARFLIAEGAAPGSRIGVCVERAEMLPIALLAVARSGASFVCLDAADSPARVAQLAETAGVAMLVVSAAAPFRGVAAKLRLVDLVAAATEFERLSGQPPSVAVPPDGEAYVVFVPSAGARPNGVRVAQRALVARLCGLREVPGLTPADVLVAITPAGLDLALLELLLPLVSGARLVVATARDCGDGARLLHLLRQAAATVLHATPMAWSRLIDADWHGQPRLRVLVASEGRDRRLVSQLLDRCSELWLLQPCVEATICAAAHRVLPHDHLLPVGRPLANTRLHVLDAAQALLPSGAPGELCIGGDGLALGYLDPACAEQQAFVDDPFAAAPARLFRTGERARVRRHGEIELLGRADRRASLDGQRIEPGEIETLLRRHPNVTDAFVRVTREAPDRVAIEAFVASPAFAQSEALAAALRGELDAALPAAARPTRYGVLEKLPRRADGTLDETRLAAPVGDAPRAAATPAAPASDIERRLLALWCTMLGREDVDVLANFFELGGHSLLAARMLGRVEAEFGRRISLAGLFRAPNIRELAQLVERRDLRDFDFRQVVKLQPLGSRPPIIGINNTGIYYMLAKRLGADQPFTSLQLFDPSVRTDQLPKTLEEIAAGYVQLIRRVQPTGPYLLMGWCVAGSLAFEIARQLDAQHAEVAQLYLMDAWVPNYLQRLPTLRSVVADYSLRWQFIVADWRRVRAQKLGLGSFLGKRVFVQKLRRLFGAGAPPAEADHDAETRQVTPEHYDQWLLGYLQTLTANYQPQVFRGRITLFRSYDEPTGWWFDPLAGWGPFAAGGVDLHMVEGDHFTMFQEPGVSAVAERIRALVDAELARQSRAA